MPFTLGMLTGANTPYVVDFNNGTSTAGSNPSWSHTVPAGVNCLVVVAGNINSTNNEEVTAVSYGGVSMTAAVTLTQTASRPHVSVWYLFNPTVGTATLQLTGNSNRFIGGSSLNLVGASSVNITTTTSNGSGAATTPSVTSTARGLVLAVSVNTSPDTATPTVTMTGDVTTTSTLVTSINNARARSVISGWSSSSLPAGTRSVTVTPDNSLAVANALVVFA